MSVVRFTGAEALHEDPINRYHWVKARRDVNGGITLSFGLNSSQDVKVARDQVAVFQRLLNHAVQVVADVVQAPATWAPAAEERS